MKVCMITHNYTRFSGDNVAPFIRYIVMGLRELGDDVVVLAAYDEAFDSKFLARDNAFVFKYAFPSKFHIKYGTALIGDKKLNIRGIVFGPFYILSGFFWLLRLHLRYRFDIINAHWVIPNGIIGLLVAKLFKIPLVISLHGSGIYLSKKNALFKALARFVFSAADGITACSPVLGDGAVELGAKPEKVKIIPYGADLDMFLSGKTDIDVLKRKLGIKHNELIVLALGRMVEKKGFEYLLRAIPDIVKRHKKCKFVFAGDGPVLNVLKTLSKKLAVEPFVEFPGDITWRDVSAYHALCDIFVVPSVFDSQGNVDGLPNVILESMASRKPIIASRIAGIALAVEDGVNGILVEAKNIDEIADAIAKLLSSKEIRQRMGKAGRRKVEDKLNWHETAKQFQETYISINAARLGMQ